MISFEKNKTRHFHRLRIAAAPAPRPSLGKQMQGLANANGAKSMRLLRDGEGKYGAELNL